MKNLPKIDCHHHLWRLENPYHWLKGPVEPRIYGDYSPICRDFTVDEFLAISRPHNVVKSVHVQANWDPNDPVAETACCQEIADSHGFPHAIVGHADLAARDLEATLEGHLAFPNMRGIRHIVGHTDPPEANVPRPDLLADPAWERGFRALGRYGLSFDLQLWPWQMAAAERVIAAHPDVPVAICHTGFPYPHTPEGFTAWRDGMQALARHAQVHAKLSGPAMTMRDWTAEAFAPYIHTTVDLFGPQRCMIGSNVPPDLLGADYDGIYTGFYAWMEPYGDDERRAMFHDTAQRFYRL